MTSPSSTADSVQAYLADRLSDADRLAFEERLLNDDGLAREAEESLRLREGLAMLRDRGELECAPQRAEPQAQSLPRSQHRSRTRPRRAPFAFAIAATAALAAVALYVGLHVAGRSSAVIAASVEALRGAGGTPPTVVGRHAFATVRGTNAMPAFAIPARGALELRVLTGPPERGGAFRVTLEKIGADHGSSSVAVAAPLVPDADGFVVIYADGSRLQAGSYALLVQSTLEPSADGVRFPFTLERPPPGR